MKPTAIFLFAALTTAAVPTVRAGTLGNGAAQRKALYQQQQTSYEYCYGGIGHVEYFSRVFAMTPGGGGGGVKFGKYLTGMGYANDGGQCRTAPTMDSAAAGKQMSESTFRSEEYHHRKIIETEWAGS